MPPQQASLLGVAKWANLPIVCGRYTPKGQYHSPGGSPRLLVGKPSTRAWWLRSESQMLLLHMEVSRCSHKARFSTLRRVSRNHRRGGKVRSGASTADRPVFFKDIPEAGFIYGLPIVMNYAVMYEYAVDRNSGQFKAPFNQIKNEPSVFTYKDTAIPTPGKTLNFKDLSVEDKLEIGLGMTPSGRWRQPRQPFDHLLSRSTAGE
jgi:hypothetical protein